ncbi:hypothetical protein GGR56DRAFT_637319 [Xylariaceae sp. FL0804]|nr:hypothetical protein GGR56DRAFT_637319 [Xylariaceae sp. FL0804]
MTLFVNAFTLAVRGRSWASLLQSEHQATGSLLPPCSRVSLNAGMCSVPRLVSIAVLGGLSLPTKKSVFSICTQHRQNHDTRPFNPLASE